MRIGVYIGSWSLSKLGGMGVYLRELLAAAQTADAAEITIIADRAGEREARGLLPAAEPRLMDRPAWADLSSRERRFTARVRKRSYDNRAAAERMRSDSPSPTATAFLWGLDDAVAAAHIDVLYFPIPAYVKRPARPYTVTIHDLKHIHRPQDHDRGDLARRRRWGRFARRAAAVFSSYEHVRRDVIAHLGVSPERAGAIELAVPDTIRRAARERDEGAGAPAINAATNGDLLPARFGLMPAQFWPHKNHALVLLALHHLRRDRNMDVPVVFTGQTQGECGGHFENMRQLAGRLRVSDLFIPTGLIDEGRLRSLYRAAAFVLAPPLYDPGSFPAMEALALGKPLIASEITSLPALVGDAGLLFNPHSVDELVEAIERVWSDAELCRQLSSRGPARIADRDWGDVAADWIAQLENAIRASTTVSPRRGRLIDAQPSLADYTS